MNKKQISRLTGRPQAQILNIEQARNLLAEGWPAADLHVHTLHSYDAIPTWQVDPLTLYEKAQRLGMTYIAFTDHDSMAAYDQIGWTREGLLPAVEVKILDPKSAGQTLHINIYAPNRGQFCEILKIALGGTFTELFDQIQNLYFRSQRNLADQISVLLETMQIAA